MWSDDLGQAIKKNNIAPYPMTLRSHDERNAIVHAVNQGIDSHLEACYVPARGDRYDNGGRGMECLVSAESLPVLVRRLLEDGDEHAMSLASAICSTLEIELI